MYVEWSGMMMGDKLNAAKKTNASVDLNLESETIVKQSYTVKQTHMHKLSYFQEWQMDQSTQLPSAQTLERSQKGLSISQLTSFMGDSRAPIFQWPKKVSAWKASIQGFSLRSFAWPMRSSPPSYSLKTC